jgi:cysteinyl-tRNA synthetase
VRRDVQAQLGALDQPGERAEHVALAAQPPGCRGERQVVVVVALDQQALVLGLPLAVGDAEVPDDVADAVRRRDEARSGRDYRTADAIRAELEAKGWVVEDTPAGTRVHRA